MRATAARHSPVGFGLLVRRPLDPDQTRRMGRAMPARPRDSRRRRTFRTGGRSRDLNAASSRLGNFAGQALLVWGTGDRFFKLDYARRLRDTFADARLVEVENGRTFIPHDEPSRLAEEIAAFQPG